MTLAELLLNRFRADLRHRGAAYVEAERISLVRVTPENIFGLVQDGAEFQTQLRYQPEDISLFCTCDHLLATKRASISGPRFWPATVADSSILRSARGASFRSSHRFFSAR